MSRIGKMPIAIPTGVNVTINGRDITVEKGGTRLFMTHRPEVTVTLDDEKKNVIVERSNDERATKAFHGMTRSLIANMVEGVNTGYKRELEINGAGWTMQVQGQNVALKAGYADTRMVPIPDGVQCAVQGNRLTITGADKQAVGQLAAKVRGNRPPEPYNGKGIKYVEEVISRKQGKAFAGGGG